MSENHSEAAAARAQHYAPSDQPVNRVAPMGGEEKRGVVTDVVVPIALGVAGNLGTDAIKAGAKAVADKVTGGGDRPRGKHQAD